MTDKMELLRDTRLFVLDMDGTFYLGDRILPGAADFLKAVKAAGKDYLFFTNNSSRSPRDYMAKLAGMGCPITRDQIMTSGDVTIRYLQTHYPDKTVYLVGTPPLVESFAQAGIDAGRIDGLSRLGTIWYVLMPMSKATIFTVTLVTFTNGWNAYFWPKIIAKNEVRRVLTVGLAQLKNTFAGQAVSNYHEIMAGAVLAIIPVVILFLIFQKYMMTGYSKAAMK